MAGGRKPEFDKEQALDAAMKVFWEKGYVGASLADLTGRMQINKPSMYGAFGNKEELFKKATQHYVQSIAHAHEPLLFESGKPIRERLKNYLMSVVRGQCEETLPTGCFVTFCMTEAASGMLPEEADRQIREAGRYLPNLLENFFEEDTEAQAKGLSETARTHALSLTTLLSGTASMARAGKKPAELDPVIECTLKGMGL